MFHRFRRERDVIDRVASSVDKLTRSMSELNTKGSLIMALSDQLKTDIGALVSTVNDAVVGEASILAIVQDLAAKSTLVGSVSDADIQGALTQVEALTTQLATASAAAVTSAQEADPTFVPPVSPVV